MTRFNRIATLTVGNSGETGLEISSLRLIFAVSKTNTPTLNSCTVEVWNLTDEAANKIKTGQRLTLKAGHTEAAGALLLFSGDVTRVSRSNENPDHIVKIECQDGERALTEKTLAVSFGARTSIKTILDTLADALGLPVKMRSSASWIYGRVYRNGFSYAGSVREALNKITISLGLVWSVQNGFLVISDPTVKDSLIVQAINADSGLVGSPTPLEEQQPGWKVSCLLEPRIEPGVTVSIASSTANGAFVVKSVRHRGDTHGNDWLTTFEVKQ